MITHRTLQLPHTGDLAPVALEARLEAAAGARVLRWAIAAVTGDELTIEATVVQADA